MDRFHPRLPHALILIFALAVRLGGAVWWESRLPEGTQFYFGDSESYWRLARTIPHGADYDYFGRVIFRTPGYPVLLAPLFFLWGDDPPVLAGRLLNVLFGTAAVAAVMRLAEMIFGRRAGVVAGLIAAAYPEAIAASCFILTEAPFTLFMLGQLLLMISAERCACASRRTGLALAAGAAAGIATLIRPSWLLFAPFSAIALTAIRGDRRRQVTLAAWQLLGLVIAMSPWWARNYAVAGRFVMTTSEVGASLYDGWRPDADGGSDMQFKNTPPALPDMADAPAIRRELANDQFWKSAAVAWARAHPRRVGELAAVKLLRMWNIWPNASEFRSLPLRLLIAMSYLPVIGLAAAGAIRFRRSPAVLICVLPAAYFTLLHMIFVSSIRYRLPPLMPLMALAAGALIWRLENRNPLVADSPDATVCSAR